MDHVLQMKSNNYQAKQLKELITKKIRRGTSLVSSPCSSSPRLLLPEAEGGAGNEVWQQRDCVCGFDGRKGLCLGAVDIYT